MIDQNFPGQYKHLDPAAVEHGDYVYALTPKVQKPMIWKQLYNDEFKDQTSE